MRYCIILLLFCTPFCLFAQTRGTLTVVKDPLLDTLIARRAFLNKINNITGDDGVNGFRVQIYFGSNRQDAYSAMAKFNSQVQGLRSYINYTEPNFKVLAGDFRTHLEAEKLMQLLSPNFTTLFIVPDKINLSKTDQPND